MQIASDAYAHVARTVGRYAACNTEGVRALTAHTNAVLVSNYGRSNRPPGGRATLRAAVAERDAHHARIVFTYAAVRREFRALLAWFVELRAACATLVGAFDSLAARHAAGPLAQADLAARGAARCREFADDLVSLFTVELSLRAALTTNALPDSCAAAWRAQCRSEVAGDPVAEAALAAAVTWGSDAYAGSRSFGLPRASEGDREALTVLVSAWSLRAYATPARVEHLLEGMAALLCK